jgi:hypothetical protein
MGPDHGEGRPHGARDRGAVTRERINTVVAVLALVGLLRTAWFHFISEPLHDVRRERIDPSYEPIRALLPPTGEVGYVCDLPMLPWPAGFDDSPVGNRMFEQAQYALAPLVLRFDDAQAPFVVGNLADPANLPELLRRKHLVLVSEPRPGTAVLRPP